MNAQQHLAPAPVMRPETQAEYEARQKAAYAERLARKYASKEKFYI